MKKDVVRLDEKTFGNYWILVSSRSANYRVIRRIPISWFAITTSVHKTENTNWSSITRASHDTLNVLIEEGNLLITCNYAINVVSLFYSGHMTHHMFDAEIYMFRQYPVLKWLPLRGENSFFSSFTPQICDCTSTNPWKHVFQWNRVVRVIIHVSTTCHATWERAKRTDAAQLPSFLTSLDVTIGR